MGIDVPANIAPDVESHEPPNELPVDSGTRNPHPVPFCNAPVTMPLNRSPIREMEKRCGRRRRDQQLHLDIASSWATDRAQQGPTGRAPSRRPNVLLSEKARAHRSPSENRVGIVGGLVAIGGTVRFVHSTTMRRIGRRHAHG